jgi:hypothetical protein
MKNNRFGRLTLSSCMLVIAATAIPLFFWRARLSGPTAPWNPYPGSLALDLFVVGTTAISACLIACAFCRVATKARPLVHRVLAGMWCVYGLAALWFCIVESSWYVDFCPNCDNFRNGHDYQVFTFPIRTDLGSWNHHSLIEASAADLGIPCSHDKPSRHVEARFAGLCVPVQLLCGLRLGQNGWYPPCASDLVQSWKKSDPDFVRQFRKRVMEDQDTEYWKSLRRQIYIACGEKNPI